MFILNGLDASHFGVVVEQRPTIGLGEIKLELRTKEREDYHRAWRLLQTQVANAETLRFEGEDAFYRVKSADCTIVERGNYTRFVLNLKTEETRLLDIGQQIQRIDNPGDVINPGDVTTQPQMFLGLVQGRVSVRIENDVLLLNFSKSEEVLNEILRESGAGRRIVIDFERFAVYFEALKHPGAEVVQLSQFLEEGTKWGQLLTGVTNIEVVGAEIVEIKTRARVY